MSQESVLIGKNIIEILTTGMYRDPLVIYREYIQNSVDAINAATSSGLLADSRAGDVQISIDKDQRKISIEDNGTGVRAGNAWSTLTSIAASDKDRTKNLGFRGIGRLAGLAYCNELVIETSFTGEDCKTILTWDSVKLKEILSNRENKQLASEVIVDIASIKTVSERSTKHFFKVSLNNVTNDKILAVSDVDSYLSMVAPISFQPRKFLFYNEINQGFKDRGVEVKCYRVFVNTKELFKPYTTNIYQSEGDNRKRIDELIDYNFFELSSKSGKPLAVAWVGITKNLQLIPVFNEAMGIRFRKGNIQVGDVYTFQRFFKDQRFHRYFVGEIHVTHEDLFPNGQRDYFDECHLLTEFEISLESFANELQKLCRIASEYNTNQKKVEECVQEIHAIKKKAEEGEFLSPEHEETERQRLEDIKLKCKKAEEKLQKIEERTGDDGDELIQNYVGFKTKSRTEAPAGTVNISCEEINDKSNKKYKANKLSQLSKKEQKLVGEIYEVIRNVLPPDVVNILIYKIEERFGLNGASEK